MRIKLRRVACASSHTPSLPAGGAGEVGPVVDRGHGLVHQRVRLDERQRVVGEGGGGLVGGRRAFAGAAAGPVSKTDDEEKQRKRTDVKTASAVCCLVESRREKQVSRVTAWCFFLFSPFLSFWAVARRCLCTTITSAAAKSLLSEGRKNTLGK